MKYRIGALVLIASLLAGDLAFSQGDAGDPQAMMQKMMEAMKLTKHHAELKDLLGSWDVTLEVKMGNLPPTKGTAEVEWLVPNRWVISRLKAPGFMFQNNYESIYVTGYDKVKMKHVSMVVDSMGPGMLTMEGVVVDPEGDIQVQYGTLDEYLTGEHDKPFKLVTRRENEDKFILEVWDLGIGEAGKPVIIQTFTRKKN